MTHELSADSRGDLQRFCQVSLTASAAENQVNPLIGGDTVFVAWLTGLSWMLVAHKAGNMWIVWPKITWLLLGGVTVCNWLNRMIQRGRND